jgi:ABC-type transport system substrate-binding protein
LASVAGAADGHAAETPKRGGTAVFGVQSAPAGFDPHKWGNDVTWIGCYAVFNTLLRTNRNGSLTPELLAAMPTRTGNLYHFTLRKGVLFHHGREMTSDDAKFSLERLMSPEEQSQVSGIYAALPIVGLAPFVKPKGGAKHISGIKIVDKYRFTIELTRSDSAFLDLLGFISSAIVPRDVVERVGQKAFNFAPVGTGPFKMTNVKPSESLTLERNEKYFIKGAPYLDKVQWNIGVAPNLSYLRTRNGQQDLTYDPLPKASLAEVQGNPTLKKQLQGEVQSNSHWAALSVLHPALKDVRVRRAVAMAIDKERYARLTGGLVQGAGTGGLFSPVSPYHQKSVGYAFNLDAAKKLLAEAGFADGFPVTIYSTVLEPYATLGQSMAQDLENLGLQVDLKTQAFNAWLNVGVATPQKGIMLEEQGLIYVNGSVVTDYATKHALPPSCCNYSGFSSPQYEKLAIAAHRATTPAATKRALQAAERFIVRDQCLMVPIDYPQAIHFVSSRLRGYKTPTYPNGNITRFDELWLAT